MITSLKFQIVILLLLLLSPIALFAAEPKNSNLGAGYIATIGLEKDALNVLIYAPKTWALFSPIDNGITFTKDFAGLDVQGSIDVRIIELGELDQTVINTKGKSKSWIVKNYIPKTVLASMETSNLKKSNVVIDGVTGAYYKYTFNNSTYVHIIFSKFGNVYMINAQTPTSQWKNNETVILQSLSTLSIKKLGLGIKK